MRGCKFGRGWPKIGDGHYPCVLALRITGAVVLFMSGGLSLGYRKGRHRGTWIAKRYSAEHRRKLLELATFLATFCYFFSCLANEFSPGSAAPSPDSVLFAFTIFATCRRYRLSRRRSAEAPNIAPEAAA